MGNDGAVRRALMEPGRNSVHEMAKILTEPLAKMADAVLSTGSARLRDTNVKVLNELADAIKRNDTTKRGGHGFISASRRTRMTAMDENLADFSPEHLKEAMEAMQRGAKATSPESRLAARVIQKHLADTWKYMQVPETRMPRGLREVYPTFKLPFTASSKLASPTK